MFFYCRILKSSKNHEERRLPFLNISSSSRGLKVAVSDQKVPVKAIEIDQNQ